MRYLRCTAIVLLLLSATANAQQEEADADGIAGLQNDIKAMRADLKALRHSLEEIQKTLATQRGPSEFSQATLRIQSEDGRPLKGYAVRMSSTAREGRKLEVTGESDASGLAMKRELPYGEYTLRVRHPSVGWYQYFKSEMVELGKPYEKVIIAPDPAKRGTVIITSDLDAAAFEGLRFGERRRKLSGAGYFSYSSPEPGETSKQYASFPTVDDGVAEPGFDLDVVVERVITQPNGDEVAWSVSRPRLPNLLVTGKRIFSMTDTGGHSMKPQEGTPYFSADESLSDDDLSIGYLTLVPQDVLAGSLRLEIPAGQVEVIIKNVYGQAAPAARASLGESNKSGKEVWLEAGLHGDSEWIPRILDLNGWERGTSISFLAKKRLNVKPGETVKFTIASPKSR